MSDDYLWNRSGPADPETQRLEQLLAPLGFRSRPLRLPDAVARDRSGPRPWRRYAVPLALAATVALLIAGAWALRTEPAPQHRQAAAAPAARGAWTVAAVRGTPRLAARPLPGEGGIAADGWVETDASSAALLAASDVGQVDIGPGSRVRVVRSGAGAHRLELERGRLEAFIWASPGRFVVETPSAIAVDLGCAYALEVDASGAGRLHVTAGWVGLHRDGRESLVPAGAVCATRPGHGPGTPHFEDATAAFIEALAALDRTAPAADPGTLATLVRDARPRDALSLWHLLTRLDTRSAALVHDRLAMLAPPPPGVTRQRVLAGDHSALDAWWNTFGLGEVGFFRMWMKRAD